MDFRLIYPDFLFKLQTLLLKISKNNSFLVFFAVCKKAWIDINLFRTASWNHFKIRALFFLR